MTEHKEALQALLARSSCFSQISNQTNNRQEDRAVNIFPRLKVGDFQGD